jgi:lipoprotein Spr
MKKIIMTILTIFICTKLFSQYTNNSTLNNFIKHWLSKPYKFGGNNEFGIDCSAFTKRLYKDVYGIKIPRTCYGQYHSTKRIKLSDIIIGDIIFFKSKLSPSGWHCGIYIGNNQFIHAANSRDRVKISCLLDDLYFKNFKGAGRVITE